MDLNRAAVARNAAIEAALRQRPLVHGDLRADNLLFEGSHRLGLDFP